MLSDSCNSTNLNGVYKTGSPGWDGIVWSGFGGNKSLTITKMRIRPVGFSKKNDCNAQCYPGEACVIDSLVDKTYSCVSTEFEGFADDDKGDEQTTNIDVFYNVSIAVFIALTLIIVCTVVDTLMRMPKTPVHNSKKLTPSERSMVSTKSTRKDKTFEKVESAMTSAITAASGATGTFGSWKQLLTYPAPSDNKQ